MSELSLAEKMNKAFGLAMDICYSTISPEGHYFDTREDDRIPDEAWAWADGLSHSYYHKMSEGMCSLQAMIDFDVAEFERTVDHDIDRFTALLKLLGKPKKLTVEEYVARGYVYTERIQG